MTTDRSTSTANLQMSVHINGREVKGMDPRTLKMIAFLTAMDARLKDMRQGTWTFNFGPKGEVGPNLSEIFDRV